MSVPLKPFLDEIEPYSPGKPVEEVQRELGLTKVVKLASNESPYPPFPQALKAIEGTQNKLNRYPSPDGYGLKKELAAFYGVKPSEIVLGNGSDELMRLIAMAVLSQGEEAIVPEPSFIFYPIATKIAEGRVKKVPLRQLKIDLNEVAKAVNSKTRLIFLANPNNPTSTIFTKQEFKEFIERVPQDVLVVLDEAYAEFVTSPYYASGLNFFKDVENLVVLKTFSKMYALAGLRIGYGIVPERLASAINKLREPFNVNALAQAAALASITAQVEVERRRRINRENRSYLLESLSSRGIEAPAPEANFVFADFKEDSQVLFRKFLRKGVILRSGHIFGDAYKTFFRITVGTQEEIDFFLQALDEIRGEV
jgi:histidinol-phosphate aminotransferase